jgi:hypothetical protein
VRSLLSDPRDRLNYAQICEEGGDFMDRQTGYRRVILRLLGLLALVAPTIARGATDEAYMCRNGDRERRVELQHAAQNRLPCQVVYWRDAKQSGDSQALWEAEHDYGYCIEQTRGLLQTLEDSGWKCQKAGPVQAEMQTIPALAPSQLPTASDADRAKLGEALARDLQRLARLTPDGHFEIEGAELGDLDRDGKADAAVLLNYQSEKRGGAQFLMAYRSLGDSFYPAAKAYVGGLDTGAVASGIERIQDGAIELLLEVRQPGDLECCPSGRRRESYVLQDGNLVARPPAG